MTDRNRSLRRPLAARTGARIRTGITVLALTLGVVAPTIAAAAAPASAAVRCTDPRGC